jgi:transmembrane sensor
MNINNTNILNSDYWYETITAYKQGELSEDVIQELYHWKAEKPEHELFFKEVEKSWEVSREKKQIPDFNTTQAWNKVKAQTIDIQEVKSISIWRNILQAPITKAAAAVLILACITWAMSNVVFTKPTFTDLQSFNGMKEFYLPDSSKVYLHDATKLRYASTYGESERMVYLDGEAFFEVQKNANKPFTVLSFKSRVVVKGTSFLVRSRAKDSVDVVEVEEGKVAVLEKYSRSGKELMLTKNMTCTVDRFGDLRKGENITTKSATWRNADLMAFVGTPLNEVVKEFKNRTGVDVLLSNRRMEQCRFTGEFDHVSNVEEILQIIALSMNLELEKKDNTYTLKGEGCE